MNQYNYATDDDDDDDDNNNFLSPFIVPPVLLQTISTLMSLMACRRWIQ